MYATLHNIYIYYYGKRIFSLRHKWSSNWTTYTLQHLHTVTLNTDVYPLISNFLPLISNSLPLISNSLPLISNSEAMVLNILSHKCTPPVRRLIIFFFFNC